MKITLGKEFETQLKGEYEHIKTNIDDMIEIFSKDPDVLFKLSHYQGSNTYTYKISENLYIRFNHKKKTNNIIFKSFQTRYSTNIYTNFTQYFMYFGLSIIIIYLMGLIGQLIFQSIDNWKSQNPPENIDSILSGVIQTGTINTGADYVSEYDKYLELNKNLKNIINIYDAQNPVISNFDPSDGIGNKEKVDKIRNNYAKKINNPTSSVSSGYLYIVASVNEGMLSNKESIYLYFGGIGGHLYKKYSLEVPVNDGKLHLLYPLNKVVFAKLPQRGYDDDKNMDILIEQNWIEILNKNNDNIYTFGFVSTSRKGKLEEVKIVYE